MTDVFGRSARLSWGVTGMSGIAMNVNGSKQTARSVASRMFRILPQLSVFALVGVVVFQLCAHRASWTKYLGVTPFLLLSIWSIWREWRSRS